MTNEFARLLHDLVIPQPILDWLGDALVESDRTEHAARQQTIKRLRDRHQQIEARIETMYLDKLEGQITREFFDRRSSDWRREQAAIVNKRTLSAWRLAPVDQAIDMMTLMSRASELFLQQPPAEKRRLLQVVVEKAAWKGGELRTALFEPFEILRHSNLESSSKEKENPGSGRDSKVWLLG